MRLALTSDPGTVLPPRDARFGCVVVVNRSWHDRETIDVRAFQNREEEGILYVPTAGEVLFRARDEPACTATPST